ncbi:MAG: hypothetical protein RIQ46_798 [Pseudomonadota bacterium]|jgi:DNA-binding MarR family transcriptional regulator
MEMPVPADTDTALADSPELALLIRLLKLGSLINAPMKEGVCDPAGISQIELKVMMALAGEGSLAGHDLVTIMGVPAMNVSRAIATLKQRGWVEDARDPDNRRRKPVRLTAAGEATYAGLGPALEGVATALAGGLTVAQQRQFGQAADRIIAAMSDWLANHHEGLWLRD